MDWVGHFGDYEGNNPTPISGPVNPEHFMGSANFIKTNAVDRVEGKRDKQLNCRGGLPPFINKPTQDAHPRYSASWKEYGKFHRRGLRSGRSVHDNDR